MPAVATYPGTVTPLRGLSAFVESERDVLLGRDRERDQLAELVTGDGFRAGLLYGEPGVGKTSLLRAGLVPHLRDHGVMALFCEDVTRPIDSFTHALATATGLAPDPGEHPMTFLARVVGQALPGQLYVFILDEVDVVFARGDDPVIGEIGDLFARVVTRSGGRARFLFSCASERVHLFGALERRTGSLFPPPARYELQRFDLATASSVLERTLAVALIAADPKLATVVARELDQGARGVLPADVQMSAMALRELQITTLAGLEAIGGALELVRAWITGAAAATGSERTALRLIAELASHPAPVAYAPEWAASRVSIDPAFARRAFEVFADKGLVVPVTGTSDDSQTHYALSHEILIPRVREIAAPARVAARRAFELLGSKAAESSRLSLREWWALRRENIAPSTPEERTVIERTRRFFTIIAAVAVAVPLISLVVVYIVLARSFYLDVAGPAADQRLVVRAGKPALSVFHWLPASPSFGSMIADTGFTHPMVEADVWRAVASHDLNGDRAEGYAAIALAALDDELAGLIAYAITGAPTEIAGLRKMVQGPGDMITLLERLEPLARGGPEEVELVEAALSDASPAVQAAALRVAASSARRRGDAYHDTLAEALTSTDNELRRIAFSAVRGLQEDLARQLYRDALATDPNPAARRELLAIVAADTDEAAPSAESAVSVLGNEDVAAPTRQKAHALLRRAFATDPQAASVAAATLAETATAATEDRVAALRMLYENLSTELVGALAKQFTRSISRAWKAKVEAVRAAALPLYARLAPQKAAEQIVLLQGQLSPELREAIALAWGEIAQRKDRAARPALEALLKDDTPAVRAAAARAYGHTGRGSQNELNKMIKTERLDVAVGAAYGLANSIEAGGNVGAAIGGIRQLWKRDGRPKRYATEAFAEIARTSPAPVFSYLRSAAREDDDDLQEAAVAGLCRGLVANHSPSIRELVAATSSKFNQVRQRIIECVADHPGEADAAIAVATRLSQDVDVDIRAEAARVLASHLGGDGKPTDQIIETTINLARDDDRAVRLIATRALAGVGPSAPAAAKKVLVAAFDRADEAEKLVLISTAQAIESTALIDMAVTDASPRVRIAAIDAALAAGIGTSNAVQAALSDVDPAVRRQALARLGDARELEPAERDRALTLAMRDADPGISTTAMTTMARVGEPEAVSAVLAEALASRSEERRARAAASTVGLLEHHPAAAVALLEPLVDDPSHDVRAAMLPALAAAWAATQSPAELGARLRGSERQAMRRIVATGALLLRARNEDDTAAVLSALEAVANEGSPLVALYARLGGGLITSGAEGIPFLQLLVP